MKRVFISFRHEDKPQINGLRLLAANPDFDIEFYDESVRTAIDSTNAEYIRRKIREKINRTSITLCMVSELTYTSQWVDWELEESIDKGNEIICMGLPNGPSNLRLPEPARRLNLQWWFWDHNRLARLIADAL
ncbi:MULTISPECIES: TIR domain-containing protein [unclassified Bradyrhizobium]